MFLKDLKPYIVWQIFEDVFAATPRESGSEERIRARIIDWINEHARFGLSFESDSIGNILVKKSMPQVKSNRCAILLQGHMDMVCNSLYNFDFLHEPLPLRIVDGWVYSCGTVLGADNGIGLSIALALLIDGSEYLADRPLEVLITTGEEIGFRGASSLDQAKLNICGKYLINLDSQRIGQITNGSACMGSVHLHKKITMETAAGCIRYKYYEIAVFGLQGGHSGLDIHLLRANAIKITAEILKELLNVCNIRLCSWSGGAERNTIPREANVKVAVAQDELVCFSQSIIPILDLILKRYNYPSTDGLVVEPNIKVSFTEVEPVDTISLSETKNIILTLEYFPTGPIIFIGPGQHDVETSANIATIKTDTVQNLLELVISFRSSNKDRLDLMRRRYAEFGEANQWNVLIKPAYPGWSISEETPFIQFIKSQYQMLIKKEVVIKGSHAGLECGILNQKLSQLNNNVVSIGPTIENAHTPREKVNIADVDVVFELLKKVIIEFQA
jgi:dipeptidase D